MVQNLGKKWANTTYVVHTQDSTINLWDVSDFHCLVKIKVLPVVIPIEFRSFIVLRSWLNDDQGLKWKISKYPLCKRVLFWKECFSAIYQGGPHQRPDSIYPYFGFLSWMFLDVFMNFLDVFMKIIGFLHELFDGSVSVRYIWEAHSSHQTQYILISTRSQINPTLLN